MQALRVRERAYGELELFRLWSWRFRLSAAAGRDRFLREEPCHLFVLQKTMMQVCSSGSP